MSRENFTNFALTSLVSPSPLTVGGTSFTVTTGQGALFPATNFLVTIDTEVLLITSRSGDVFTVGTRGFDSTVAASHAVGAGVQLSVSSYNFTHLWQNVSDTHNPLVPPVQIPGRSASQWDNEFESLGSSWVLFPSTPASGTTWNAGTALRSHLVLDYGSGDNATYYAYVPFSPPSGSWMATMKLSATVNFNHPLNTNDQVQISFTVSDATNPTAGFGNYVQMQYLMAAQTTSAPGGITGPGGYTQPYSSLVRMFSNNTLLGPCIAISFAIPIYLRIFCDGSGNYTGSIGDGTTFSSILTKTGFTSTIRSLVLDCLVFRPSNQFFAATMAVDSVRVVTGVTNPNWG